MTPLPRYRLLNDALQRLRGRDFQFRLKGIDELAVTHDSSMLEACNTSFQVHLQVGAEEFARLYNVAQLAAAPVLAAAANSPLLFGKRLWRETRIALFQLAIDTRVPLGHVREEVPRVHFGRRWLEGSVLEIFRADVARFRALLAAEVDEDPFAELAAGRAPQLSALQLFNGTVYRWNRPCYGVVEGRAHLRIENRVLPAGPTPLDEIANAAFWIGLIKGVDEEIGDVTRAISFDAASESFLAAARLGLDSQLAWPGREPAPAAELILGTLLPLARDGLAALGLDEADAEGYLGVIEQRVRRRRTGAQWQLESLAAFGERGSRAERLAALTAAMVARGRDNTPVHEWPPARLEEAGGWERHYSRLAQLMTTDLFTVNQDELVDVVASLMDWEHIRHVPVEDGEHRLVGLVTHRALLRLLARRKDGAEPTPVSAVMTRDPITATPDTPTFEAVRLMREHKIGCLPVVDGQKLVGIVTERDFLEVAGKLLEEQLRAAP
jgi:CBS domain-containing protein